MTLKKRYLIGAATGALMLAAIAPANALIPVFDGSTLAAVLEEVQADVKAYALQISGYIMDIRRAVGEQFSWVTQYAQYLTQLQQYYAEGMTLLNFAHHPTYGAAMGLMNKAGLSNALPFNPQSAMNLFSGMSYGQGAFAEVGNVLNSLTSMASNAFASNHLYQPTDNSWWSQQLTASGNSIAAGQGMAMAAYTDSRDHMAVLPSLRQLSASADTTKDQADAANQIAVETAWNVGQLGQVTTLAWMAAQQREARAQRDEERLACELEQYRSRAPQPCPTGANGALTGGGGGANGGSDIMPVPPVPLLAGNDGAQIAMQPPIPVPPQPPANQPPAFQQPPPVPAVQQQAAPPPDLANVDGGDGQEVNLNGPVAPNVVFPPTPN